MFEWNDVRVFLAVHRDRTLSAAGRRLGVQQSTVGRRLAALEAALGAKLFERADNRYALTAGGESLLGHAERMEDEMLSAERALVGREGAVAGVVRVTTAQAFGHGVVAPLLGPLRKAYPEILVELVADNSALSLSRREADLALRLGRPGQPSLVARRLAELTTGLFASRDYLRRRGRPRGEDLADHEVVDYDESYLNREAIAWLRQRARGAQCVARLNSSEGIAAAIEAGMGVGALPCWLGNSRPTLERVLPKQGYAQQLWLVLHRDLRRVARFRAVSDFLAEALKRAAPRLQGAGA